MTCKYRKLSTMFVILAQLAVPGAHAWTRVDYVNPSYVLSYKTSADTTAAQRAIIALADEAAKHGPWSARSGEHTAPSGDPADYLSWAEHYWPDCGCNEDAAAVGPSATTTYANSTGTSQEDQRFVAETSGAVSSQAHRRRTHPKRLDDAGRAEPESSPAASSQSQDGAWNDVNVPEPDAAWGQVKPHNIAKKPSSTLPPSTKSGPTSTTSASIMTTTTITSAEQSCKASPSSSPAAGETACPYVPRESVNPDTQSLPGPIAVDQGPDGALYNAVAYALTQIASYADNASAFLKTLFIDDPVYPSARFAGLVRVSGGRNDTAAGLLDFRGLVKVANALQILRQSQTVKANVDEGIQGWAKEFLAWVESSEQGRNASTAADHLSTLYFAQLAALHLIQEDTAGAKKSLDVYFSGPFMDQIDGSGKQGVEAGINAAELLGLEGMMTAAKIGSSLGIDFWHRTTTAGSNIRSAVEYMMRESTGAASDLAPHVAVAKAVYGDKEGIYAAWLNGNVPDHHDEPWWFFDQPEAIATQTLAKRTATLVQGDTEDGVEIFLGRHIRPQSSSASSNPSPSRTSGYAAVADQSSSASGSVGATSSNTTRSTASTDPTSSSRLSSATSSVMVFQTSPGPMPPSQPDNACQAATSSCTQPEMSTSTSEGITHPKSASST